MIRRAERERALPCSPAVGRSALSVLRSERPRRFRLTPNTFPMFFSSYSATLRHSPSQVPEKVARS